MKEKYEKTKTKSIKRNMRARRLEYRTTTPPTQPPPPPPPLRGREFVFRNFSKCEVQY